MFRTLIDKNVQYKYKWNDDNYKGADQEFLSKYIWPLAINNATMHDSYSCNFFGGEPFPSERPLDRFCFAACFWPCCDKKLNQTDRMPECPIECRPKNHQDWIYC